MKLAESATERKLAELEEEIRTLKARVAKLEATAHSRPEALQARSHEEDEELISAGQAEYLIGAHVLPRIGAGLIVLAIIIFAILGSTGKGGPAGGPIFAVELVACFAFIAVGEWKRNELEGFGQILTAIGSFGLYLAAVVACFAQNTIEVRALAGICGLLALANLSYASWRSARAFHVIGVLGGFAGTLFALYEHDFAVAATVFGIVALAGAAVALAKSWPELAIVQWALYAMAVVVMVASGERSIIAIPALYGATLACLAAYGLRFAAPKVDHWGLSAAIALFVTGLIGYGIDHTPIGAVHLLALATASGFLAQSFPRDSRARLSLSVSAIATAALLIPSCFLAEIASATYSVLAVAAWAIARHRYPKLAAGFSVLVLVMSGGAYWTAVKVGIPFWLDNALLAAFAAGMAGSSLIVNLLGRNGSNLAALGYWILISRWAQVLFDEYRLDIGAISPSTVAWVVYSLALLTLGFIRPSITLRLWSFGVMFGTVCKILLLDLRSTSALFKVAILLALGLVMLVGGYLYIRQKEKTTA